jgi:hypothetical protein
MIVPRVKANIAAIPPAVKKAIQKGSPPYIVNNAELYAPIPRNEAWHKLKRLIRRSNAHPIQSIAET